MDLKAYIKEKEQIVTAEIHRILSAEPPHPLSEIFSYAMEGGKRFRPILIMAAAEACGLAGEKTLPTAVAMEMIHNFSLIHDDLPCMDNDLERRGKRTVHAKFGETDALLAGDGLLIFAFNMVSRNAGVPGIRPDAVLQVLKLFSGSAGHLGMTGGQILDMYYQKAKSIEPPALERLHSMKTGALITASVMAGGILAEAPPYKLKALEVYGKNIGLTYQIIDDLMDEGEDADAISFPRVFGKKEAREKAEEATNNAIAALGQFDEKARPLRELATFLLNRNK